MNVGTMKKLLKKVPDETEIEIPFKAIFGEERFRFSPLFMLISYKMDDDEFEEPHDIIQLHPIGLNEYMEREDGTELFITNKEGV